ncbi:MAG: Maf family nucleotide pyrophosphatase [Bacteroidales bacterium]
MLLELIKNYHIILGSASPRRKELLKGLGLQFDIEYNADVSEDFDLNEDPFTIPILLSQKKANHFHRKLEDNEILITADTLVICEGKILGKPVERDEAFNMLSELSGKSHFVITGVTLKSSKLCESFFCETKVFFKNLSDKEIYYYIDNFQPFDKAGAYGVQEWIGFNAITRIEGSYFNVVGLPVQMLSEKLKEFILKLK